MSAEHNSHNFFAPSLTVGFLQTSSPADESVGLLSFVGCADLKLNATKRTSHRTESLYTVVC